MGVDTKVGNFLLYDNNWVNRSSRAISDSLVLITTSPFQVQFFEWMLANTTDDNIYTDMELNE